MALSSPQIIQTESATPRPTLDSKNPQNKNMKICTREISDNHRLVWTESYLNSNTSRVSVISDTKLSVYATKCVSLCGVVNLCISENSWGINQKEVRKSEDHILFYGPTD